MAPALRLPDDVCKPCVKRDGIGLGSIHGGHYKDQTLYLVIFQKLDRCIRSHTCADHRERLLNVQRIDNAACLTGSAEEAGSFQLTAGIAMAHEVEGGRGDSMKQELFPEQTEIPAIRIAGAVQNQNLRGGAVRYNVSDEWARSSINLKNILPGNFIPQIFDDLTPL